MLAGVLGGLMRDAAGRVSGGLRAGRRRAMTSLVDRENPPRTKQFYEENGAKRNYFYFMDNRGRLYLEETKRRNMATCLKDPKFLDFTIRNMKPNDTGIFNEMESVSFCGKERNFISHADRLSPLTFREKVFSDDTCEPQLLFAGTLMQPYEPNLLAFHPETGRIYHKITHHKFYEGKYGLLHPNMCLELGENITFESAEQNYIYHAEDGVRYSLELFDVITPLK